MEKELVQWISVKDRLPKKYEEVLIFWSSGNRQDVSSGCLLSENEKDVWQLVQHYEFGELRIITLDLYEINSWMPMPTMLKDK
jgi:hypothetical protein